ncbi:MAG: 5'-deoxynucleotidase [Lachnospiraceae bacterium]
MIHFYSYISRMKHIKRWGLMKNTEQENIKEHSFDVAVTAHALALIGNTYFNKNNDVHRIMELALFHETSEVITGDLATPIKYFNPQIKKSFSQIENITMKLYDASSELSDEYRKVMMHDSDRL